MIEKSSRIYENENEFSKDEEQSIIEKLKAWERLLVDFITKNSA